MGTDPAGGASRPGPDGAYSVDVRRPATVSSVAAGALADGTPVIISGGLDGTVRVWRLADGTPNGEPLYLPESVLDTAVHGSIVATAAWADIAMHEIALQVPIRQLLSYFGTKRTVETIG